MAFDVVIHELAVQELDEVRPFDRRKILASIREQLIQQPLEPTRNRKILADVRPSFEFVPPVWELRVGTFRVFYDVDEAARLVHVRSVRRKTASESTKEIL
jgi:mRNA-degrading endonuclease RelE of RelBE toxin-antitoxin system